MVEFFLDGVIETAKEAIETSSEIRKIRDKDMAKIQSLSKRESESGVKLLNYLFEHPNTHIADICITQQCGGSYLQEYQLLKQQLQIISGENNITYDLYESLNQLNIKRNRIINSFIRNYESGYQSLMGISEKLEKNCEFSTQYLTSDAQQCLGDAIYEALEIEINNSINNCNKGNFIKYFN